MRFSKCLAQSLFYLVPMIKVLSNIYTCECFHTPPLAHIKIICVSHLLLLAVRSLASDYIVPFSSQKFLSFFKLVIMKSIPRLPYSTFRAILKLVWHLSQSTAR